MHSIRDIDKIFSQSLLWTTNAVHDNTANTIIKLQFCTCMHLYCSQWCSYTRALVLPSTSVSKYLLITWFNSYSCTVLNYTNFIITIKNFIITNFIFFKKIIKKIICPPFCQWLHIHKKAAKWEINVLLLIF